jgi:hypothetical protein
MSESKRWIEGGGPEGAGELLRAVMVPRPLRENERARSLEGVRRLAPLAPPTTHLGAWAKLALGLAGIGVGLLVMTRMPGHAKVQEPASIAVSPVPEVTTEPSARVEPPDLRDLIQVPSPVTTASPLAAEPAKTAPRRPPTATSAPVPMKAPTASVSSDNTPDVAAEDSILREARLLEKARRSLSLDPAAALVVCDEHAHVFPQGQLHAERDLVKVEALRRLGRYSEARGLAKSLQQASPFYGARVRRLIESMPGDASSP